MINENIKKNYLGVSNNKKYMYGKNKKYENNFFINSLLPIPWELWPVEVRFLISMIIFWSLAGLFILGSASWWVAIRENGDGAFYIKRQILWLIASLIIGWRAISIPIKKWIKISGFALLLGTLLIAITAFMGSTINGSTRWLIVGPLQIQPSELIKPFIIIQASTIFGYWNQIFNEKKIFWILTFVAIIMLIVKQPNLSTAALTGIIIWMIALGSGINLKTLLGAFFIGSTFGISSILTHEYQKLRVLSFLNPWKDPEGNGYQLIQSLLAIGSGGIFGQGYGLSTQKLQYLPIQSTDFIYAVFAEEFGFIGSFMFFIFLSLIALLGLKISLMCSQNHSKLIAIGCSTMLVGQSIMHIAVASGVMPTTGLPLPLISYGGNSLVSSILIASLLIRCGIESYQIDEKNFLIKRKF